MRLLKSRLVVLLSIALCVSILVSCGSDDPKKKYDIYTSGFSSAIDAVGGKPRSVSYWKNGEEFKISDGSTTVFPGGLAVSDDGDVYVGGIEYLTETGHGIATYWKNGVPVRLSDGTKSEGVRGICVVGNDVYACGYQQNELGEWSPKYWRNGQGTILPAKYFGTADGIVVTGNDVHVMGWQSTVDTVYANYWKNGKVVEFAPKKSYRFYSDMISDGNDIYIVGYDGDINGGLMTGRVWKNGTEALTLGSAWTTGMTVSGDAIYVATEREGGYWKNKDFVPVEEKQSGRLFGVKVAVAGGDVIFLASSYTGNTLLGSYLLINGTAQAPFTGDDGKTELTGLVVK
jgi:hypothetical protein